MAAPPNVPPPTQQPALQPVSTGPVPRFETDEVPRRADLSLDHLAGADVPTHDTLPLASFPIEPQAPLAPPSAAAAPVPVAAGPPRFRATHPGRPPSPAMPAASPRVDAPSAASFLQSASDSSDLASTEPQLGHAPADSRDDDDELDTLPRSHPAPSSAGLRPLATATVAVRDGRFVEARQILDQLLADEPENEQAIILLDLVLRMSSTKRRGKRTSIVLLLAFFLVLGGIAAAGFLIRTPVYQDVDCNVARELLPPVKAPIAGMVERVDVKKGERVKKGSPLLVIVDTTSATLKKALLKKQRSDLELLDIMMTGGSDAHEQRQKKLLAELKLDLAALGGTCTDSKACAVKRQQLRENIATAKKKLKFCEWKAYPREREALKKQIDARKKRLAALAARKLRQKVLAPRDGLITNAEIESRAAVKAGKVLVEMARGDRFLVTFAAAKISASQSLQIKLKHQDGSSTTYRGKLEKGSKKPRALVSTDVTKVNLNSSCSVRLRRGDQPLIFGLFE
jgi:multidrug resistance efflux pump